VWTIAIASALGQAYEPSPCRASPNLYAELTAGDLGISPVGPRFQLTAASSVLSPGSAPPDLEAAATLAEARGLELGDPRDASLKVVADDLRSCRYGPTNLTDGDEATAWCEGADGHGVGETVVVELPGPSVQIRAGYGKSPERYRQNGRPHTVEVLLLGPGFEPPVQGAFHAGVPVLGRHEVELADRDGWQALPLPPRSAPADLVVGEGHMAQTQDTPRFVALRIRSVYEGERWADTCISELRTAE